LENFDPTALSGVCVDAANQVVDDDAFGLTRHEVSNVIVWAPKS
jgi:hypothetical protein